MTQPYLVYRGFKLDVLMTRPYFAPEDLKPDIPMTWFYLAFSLLSMAKESTWLAPPQHVTTDSHVTNITSWFDPVG